MTTVVCMCVSRWLEWVGPMGAVQQPVRRRDSNPDSDLSVTSRGVVPVWGCGGGGPTLQLAALHGWAPQSLCALCLHSIHLRLSLTTLFYALKLNMSAWCVQSVCLQLFSFFPFLHLVHLLLWPSSISQCFDLRSACWKGDFDRWKILMTWSTVFKTIHAQDVKIMTWRTNG